jgi:ABC-type branched-subunit amino acid transport system ATPase component
MPVDRLSRGGDVKMCGSDLEMEEKQTGTVAEIVCAVVKNEKFFENMTTEEKVKSVVELYHRLYHEVATHG